jgi:hypothetical protein
MDSANIISFTPKHEYRRKLHLTSFEKLNLLFCKIKPVYNTYLRGIADSIRKQDTLPV